MSNPEKHNKSNIMNEHTTAQPISFSSDSDQLQKIAELLATAATRESLAQKKRDLQRMEDIAHREHHKLAFVASTVVASLASVASLAFLSVSSKMPVTDTTAAILALATFVTWFAGTYAFVLRPWLMLFTVIGVPILAVILFKLIA